MKKILLLIATITVFFPAMRAQETPDPSLPKVGDIRAGFGPGIALTLFVVDKLSNYDVQHAPIIWTAQAEADYTFMTFSGGKFSLAGGAMFDFCHWSTWSSDKEISKLGFKSTRYWTKANLVATLTARYRFGKNFEAFGRIYAGMDLQLGYKEEYSNVAEGAILPPHVNPPGNTSTTGVRVGIGRVIDKKGVFLHVGTGYTTIGLTYLLQF